MKRRLAWCLAPVLAVWTLHVQALGLGEIDVRSRLNQKFSATIPVTAASAEDIETLRVRLASTSDFERAGVERTEYLGSLVFTLDPGGHVRVTGKQIAREPLLNFIVEASWRGGRLLREYTVFLDPPAAASASPTAAAAADAETTPAPVAEPPAPAPKPAPKLASKPEPKPAEPTPIAETPAPAPAAMSVVESAAGGRYGPVAPKETLWSVGVKVRPSADLTMDQVLLALYTANPGAFIGGIGGLQKNSTLSVPDAATMRAVDPDTAKARVAELRAGAASAPAVAAAPAKPAPPPAKAAAEKAAAAKKPVKPTPPAAAATASESVFDRLAASSPTPAAKPGSSTTVATDPAAAAPPTPAKGPAPAANAAPAEPAKAATSGGADAGKPATMAPGAAGSAADTAKPAAVVVVEPAKPATAAPSPAESGNAPAPTTAPTNAPPPTDATTPASPAPSVAAKPAVVAETEQPAWLIPLLVIFAVLLLLGLLLWRRRSGSPDPKPVVLTPKANLRAANPLPPIAPVAREARTVSPASPAVPTEGGLLPAATTTATATAAAAIATPPPPLSSASTRQSSIDTLLDDGAFDTVKPAAPAPVLTSADANDPLAEADFHLAYNLFDEAATLLRQAIAKNPDRAALHLKLAETFFAAKRPLDFLDTAEAMRGRVTAADWQTVKVMGRKLVPDAPLFQDEAGAAVSPPPPASPQPSAAAAFAASAAPDFELDFQTPPSEPAKAPPPPAPLDINLLDFDLDQPEPKAAAPVAAPVATSTDIDLSAFDQPQEAPAAAKNSVEFNLDELDLAQPEAAVHGSGQEDQAATKLDLARAYSDMGDNEAARGLLEEVVAGGSARQKQEAETLLRRLSA